METIKALLYSYLPYFIGAVIIGSLFFILNKILDKRDLSNIKKRLEQIPNGKLKQKFLENKYSSSRYNGEGKMTKAERVIKKVQGITVIPISLEEWDVYVTYEYKRAHKESVEYARDEYEIKEFKKGDVNAQKICTISEMELQNDKDCQKFIKDSKNP